MNELDLKILAEIVKRRNELVDLSIFELAEYSNVSPSKITKTCQKLGCTGYKQLKYTLQDTNQIMNESALVIFQKLDILKNEILNETSLTYSFFMSKKKLIIELQENAYNGVKSELMLKIMKILNVILNYYSLVLENEVEKYYQNFSKLILEELLLLDNLILT